MSREKLVVLSALAPVGLLLGSAAQAATLSLNTTTLLPGTAGQTIQLLVNGSDTNVVDDDVAVQVGDGGTANGGTSTGPTITGLDLKTGTIFSSTSNPVVAAKGPLVMVGDVLPVSAVSDTNAGNPVLLATVTLSTVGFTGSSFTLSFENVSAKNGGPFPTDLILSNAATVTPTGPGAGGSPTVTISVVPEPATAGLGVLCLGGVLLKRRSRGGAYTLAE